MPSINEPNVIKVTVSCTITLNASDWANYQGISDAGGRYTVADVRRDVRAHCLELLQQSSFLGEASAEVEPK